MSSVKLNAFIGVATLAFCVGAAGSAGAQSSPKPEVQAAPMPARLADGKPNWTGFWTPIGGLLDRNFGPGFKPRAPGAPNPARAPSAPRELLKSPYKEKYEQIQKDTSEGKVAYDDAALCLPPGMPRMMGATYGLEILQTPGQITMTSEYQAESRRIWLDGRKHPNADEALPTYAGHSIGHWEGDVLVVDTVQTRDDIVIDQTRLPQSLSMHMTERFREPQPGILEDEITVDDPKVYEKPWSMTKRYRYRPELNLEEYVCEDNNRNVSATGAPSFK
jgi:hypothetical protein